MLKLVGYTLMNLHVAIVVVEYHTIVVLARVAVTSALSLSAEEVTLLSVVVVVVAVIAFLAVLVLVEGAVINVLEALHVAISRHVEVIWASDALVMFSLQIDTLEVVEL